jgi:acyl-[acyl-carrier-protein]-phospholipid O-acyltransferase/long-chain-fatty-acid--[acyl-carrier-protein] ligase
MTPVRPPRRWQWFQRAAVGLAVAVLLALGVTEPAIFAGLVVLTLVGALAALMWLPEDWLKRLAAALFRFCYQVEVRGLENFAAAGERVVVVANHISFLDAPLLAIFLPRSPTFAIDSFVVQRWWVRPFLRLAEVFPLDPTDPLALKSLVKAVRAGRTCVIFPEGRITVTGALMKIYEGPGLVADRAGAKILPVRIDGAQYTPFSRLRGKVRLRFFPQITLTLLPPEDLGIDHNITGRARRDAIGCRLYEMMTRLAFETCNHRRTLFAALLDARTIYGGRALIVEDIERRPMSYNRLIAGSFVLGRHLARLTGPGERVGVLLPNSVGATIVFWALQAYGRVPALLNFSTGTMGMRAACEAAQLRTVLTSRRFLTAARLEEAAAALETPTSPTRLVYLEDLHARIGPRDRLFGLVAAAFGRVFYGRRRAADDPAVVLFTSGSEGTPKGVVLSHQNILANLYQVGAVIDFMPTDLVFNVLPIFHAFGLTGGLLLPMLSGVRSFLYPSPLHYRIVPEMVYGTNATILFGTDTFLSGYARAAHPYDFFNLRYVFAGAERVRDETRRLWTERFGLRILEGYGATETAPVIAVNTPMQFKTGTVGRLLPGIECRRMAVPSLERGARLVVRGPNVMLGYLRVGRPGVLEPPPDGWYDTGDIVDIDAGGFVTILGRAKRFAKVAGEMVSLAAVEELAARLWPEHRHAAVAIPDPRKGEQIALVTDRSDAERDALVRQAQRTGLSEIFVPRFVLPVEPMPLLGTGKIDYPAVASLVRDRVTLSSAMLEDPGATGG